MQHRDTEALDFESGLVVGLFDKRVAEGLARCRSVGGPISSC